MEFGCRYIHIMNDAHCFHAADPGGWVEAIGGYWCCCYSTGHIGQQGLCVAFQVGCGCLLPVCILPVFVTVMILSKSVFYFVIVEVLLHSFPVY